MAVGEDDVLCACCNAEVKDSDKAFLCDGLCKKWYHAKCADISDKQFVAIEKLTDHICWMCKTCLVNVNDIRTSLENSDEFVNTYKLVTQLIKILRDVQLVNLNLSTKMDQLINSRLACTCNVTSGKSEDKQTKLSSREGESKGDRGSDHADEIIPSAGAYSQPKSKNQELGWPRLLDKPNQPMTVKLTSDECKSGDDASVTPVVGDNDNQFLVDTREEEHADAASFGKSVMGTVTCNKTVSKAQDHKQLYANKVKYGRKNQQLMIGTKSIDTDSCCLKAVDNKKWLFVSRIQPGTSDSDVVTYLNKAGIKQATCTKLKTSFDTYNAFKVGISESDFDVVFCNDFWPRGSLVRVFNQNRRTVYQNRAFLATVSRPNSVT